MNIFMSYYKSQSRRQNKKHSRLKHIPVDKSDLIETVLSCKVHLSLFQAYSLELEAC